MPRGPRGTRSTATPRDGPIRPGTPLYRLLQMIARQIADGDLKDRPRASPDDAPPKG
jgi:hypothetical protein